MILFAGVLEGAIIGGLIGLVVGLIAAFVKPGQPCPRCQKKLPVPWFTPPAKCPQCGCHLQWVKGKPLADEPNEDEVDEPRDRYR